MKINVNSIKTEKIKLDKLIEKYQETYLSYYNELNNCKDYWKDNNSIFFFEVLTKEKYKNNVFYENLLSFNKIYDYIINKYISIGDNIYYKIENYDYIITKINNNIAKLETIIKKYRNVNNNLIQYRINNHINRLQKNKSNLLNIKEETTEKFNNIIEIEKNITTKLKQLDVEDITIETENYTNRTQITSSFYIELNSFENSIKKLLMFKKEEINLYNELIEIIKNLNSYYKTNKNKNIEEINVVILNNFKTIITIHQNNVFFLEKIMYNYKNSIEKSKQVAIKISEGGIL